MHSWLWAILIVATTAVFPECASATVVVAVFQGAPAGPRTIIGADGLDSLTTLQGEPISTSAICKIQQIEAYYFAIAGPTSSPNHSYDAYRALKNSLTQSGTFEGRMRRFEAEILKELNAIANWPPSDRMLQVIVIDSANLSRYYLANVNRHDNNPWVFLPSSGVREVPPAGKVVILGIADDITLIPKAISSQPVDTIKQMIGIEAKQHPDKVGEPVAVVDLTADETRWPEPGACSSKPIR